MSEPILPENIQELLAGYVLGDLTPQEAEEVRQLLETHPEMNNEVDRLQEVLATIPYSLPEVMPSVSLKSSILAATSQPEIELSVKPKQWKLLSLLGTSILALSALFFAWNNYHLRQQVASLQNQLAQQKDAIAMLQESQTKLVSLKGMKDSSNAYGKAIITPGHPEAILLMQNLPVLPSGKSYQLWCVVNGKKIASGNFNSNTQGKVFVKVPFSVTSEISALAVTVEVSPNPPTPTGPMVMTSSL
jgi:anti-sigma-K factor RskA